MNGDSHGGTGILDQFGSFTMGHCRTRTAIDLGQNITATQFATHGHLIHTAQDHQRQSMRSLNIARPHHLAIIVSWPRTGESRDPQTQMREKLFLTLFTDVIAILTEPFLDAMKRKRAISPGMSESLIYEVFIYSGIERVSCLSTAADIEHGWSAGQQCIEWWPTKKRTSAIVCRMRSTWRRTDCIVVLEYIFCWALHPNEYLNLGPSFGAKKRKKEREPPTLDKRLVSILARKPWLQKLTTLWDMYAASLGDGKITIRKSLVLPPPTRLEILI